MNVLQRGLRPQSMLHQSGVSVRKREPELTVNAKAIDNWFDKITMGLSERQKADLKKKWGKKGPVYGSGNRIELIAWDIAVHFNENFKKLDQGMKGQIATERKRAAILYKKALDATGLVTSAQSPGYAI